MKSLSIPPVYFLAGVLIIITSYWVIPGLNIIHFPYNLLGLLVIISGFYFLANSYQLFKLYNTPHSFDESTVLITEGIFKHTRNPMYLGMTLLLAGLSVCFGNIIAMTIPFLFFLILLLLFIPYEEKKMENSFGKDYLFYKETVRRWI